MKSKPLKLVIELVPETCWYSNFRAKVSRRYWEKLRKDVIERAGYKCEVCGRKPSRLFCHEKWRYDDRKLIQKLTGFQAICSRCNWVKHIGYAGLLAEEGRLDFEEKVVKHFMKVNRVGRKRFEDHRERAFRVWERRSEQKWRTDFGEFRELIKKARASTRTLETA